MPRLSRILLLLSAALTTACASTPPKSPTPTGGDIHTRNQAYSLLYKLMSDESDVAKILIIKQAGAPVVAVVKDIATFAQSSKKQLDDFQKSDPQLHFDQPDLPALEQESRDLAAKTEGRDLLTSSGKNFEVRLVFTQSQAMSYAAQLAKPLADHEPNPPAKTSSPTSPNTPPNSTPV
jgi:hypothetical protein